MKKKTKTILATAIIIILTLSLAGCRTKGTKAPKLKNIELTYYRLFDNEEIFLPIIQEFESQNRNIKIHYRKFTDPIEYENLIINELAEGEGPDLFSMNAAWMPKHAKKIAIMPSELMDIETFKNTFVNTVSQDLLLYDEEGNAHIAGLPLSVDNLALYYNKALFEEKIPSRGKPAITWEEIKEDVFKLNKKDNSFERFEVSGMAMGRTDNILRGVDSLYLLMLQNKTQFYDEDFNEAIFTQSQGITETGAKRYPAIEAVNLFTSFALPTNKNYSWNIYLSDASSPEKELKTFAKGKVAMVIGYSYLYEQIVNEIEELKSLGLPHINKNDIKVAQIPQIFNPSETNYPADTYANYFAETVSRTTKYPVEAWKFLIFLSQKENIQYYNEKTHRPTSRRDLIEEQIKDPIYGVFASQLGFAKSIPMADSEAYEKIFEKVIEQILNGQSANEALMQANEAINKLIPQEGLYSKIKVK
ncbi:extracellular solute-binding protein [Candidatus Peregrinibacteria bacterium]|nr:extracellular solute-binding protein [Candidatus Peregrinibacteria bacterium]